MQTRALRRGLDGGLGWGWRASATGRHGAPTRVLAPRARDADRRLGPPGGPSAFLPRVRRDVGDLHVGGRDTWGGSSGFCPKPAGEGARGSEAASRAPTRAACRRGGHVLRRAPPGAADTPQGRRAPRCRGSSGPGLRRRASIRVQETGQRGGVLFCFGRRPWVELCTHPGKVRFAPNVEEGDVDLGRGAGGRVSLSRIRTKQRQGKSVRVTKTLPGGARGTLKASVLGSHEKNCFWRGAVCTSTFIFYLKSLYC